MSKRSRRHDLRRVRKHTSYTVPEAAAVLGVAIGTVRKWRRDGLPALDERRPILIFGADLKSWLGERAKLRKRKCGFDEMYCFRCRAPQKPQLGTVRITPRNQKTLLVSGRCGQCGTKMNKGGSVAKIPELINTFGINTMRQEHLVGCDTPLLKRDLEKEDIE